MNTSFALLTAAKNEEQYIEGTIRSVLAQDCRPVVWLIMNDGSTDRTEEIVARYAKAHPFIELLSVPVGGARSFGAQYRAINAAYECVRHREFGVVGVLDADIEYAQRGYTRAIIERLRANPRLGLAGGYVHERTKGAWKPRVANSPDSVAGGIQMFRRACFEQIGGYTPLLHGGEDWLASIKARMAGWDVQAYPDYPVHHFRPTSSAGGRARGLFRLGMMDGSFGSHPLFELMKCIRRARERPFVLGSIVRLAGYSWWNLSYRAPLLGSDTANFIRREQVRKMWQRASTNLRMFGLSGGPWSEPK
jgi:glycosyltransferase involved in cell wall biosynthesis